MIRKRTTFILGAGFSAEQQFPLLRGLRSRVLHFLEAERHSSYEWFLTASDEFPCGQFYEGLQRIDRTAALGFEELLIACRRHLATADQSDPCFVTDRVLRIGTARMLWCMTWFARPVERCYREFARWLTRGLGDRHVITFNWDILVEQALSELGSSWQYAAGHETTQPTILKPHGSINWSGWAKNPSNSSPHSGWTPVGPGSRLRFDLSNPLGNPDTYELHPDLRVCLYPGDPDLPEHDPDVSLIWKDVGAVIDSSDEVVFIGYSLPEYDSYAAMRLQSLCSGKSVAVYDPGDATLDRFLAAFPGAALHKEQFSRSPYAQHESA